MWSWLIRGWLVGLMLVYQFKNICFLGFISCQVFWNE